MSSNDSSDGPSSTTTVSSVLVQAGDCRIVIAILKCGEWVQLQLAESVPNLLEIGSNQEETKKLLQDHELLLAKLKNGNGAHLRGAGAEFQRAPAENKPLLYNIVSINSNATLSSAFSYHVPYGKESL